MSAFVAQYTSPCAAGDQIIPGDRVLYVNDVLVHAGCEGDALSRRMKGVKPGPWTWRTWVAAIVPAVLVQLVFWLVIVPLWRAA